MTHEEIEKKSHHNRDDLTGEHTLGDSGQIILFCLFTITWTADTFFFNYTTFLNQYVPLFIRIPLGIILLIFSVYLAKTGLAIVFGEERETPVVIRKGVFNVVRHPIYLSEILLYFGILFFSICLAALMVCLVAIVFLNYISRHEEKLLLARFGNQYGQYIREVPMWFPQFWKR